MSARLGNETEGPDSNLRSTSACREKLISHLLWLLARKKLSALLESSVSARRIPPITRADFSVGPSAPIGLPEHVTTTDPSGRTSWRSSTASPDSSSTCQPFRSPAECGADNRFGD